MVHHLYLHFFLQLLEDSIFIIQSFKFLQRFLKNKLVAAFNHWCTFIVYCL